MAKKEKVLIVGGGFAGIKAALGLANHPNFEVTLLTESDHFRYYPTLYLAATGRKLGNASIPLDSLLSESNVRIVKGTAEKIDRQSKHIITRNHRRYEYDTLILALGVVTNYFGIPGLEELSYSIKSEEQVKRFKNHLHQQLIMTNKPDHDYVIVGGGPTGIELAGALPAYLKQIIKNHNLPSKHVNIDIIEASPRLLPNLPKRTSKQVKKRLDKLGINLHLKRVVQGETADSLTVSGKPINTHTVIWTAGVTNHPFFKNNNFVLMGRGKVAVDAYLQTEPGIFVLGDNANTPFSGMAQTALYDGEFIAENLIRYIENKTLRNYNPKKPITVVPAGEGWAAVNWGRFSFKGRIGHIIREAADIEGFHDLEPWPKASRQYLSEYINDEDCDVCALAMSKY